MKTSKIAVTGTTGFLGRAFLAALVDAGFDVSALVRHADRHAEQPGVRSVALDLASPDKSDSVFEELQGISAVAHVAHYRCYKDFPAKAREMFTVNSDGALYLLEMARRLKAERFLLVSTGGVYGRRPGIDLNEELSPSPDSFYARTKLIAEILAQGYRTFFRVTIVRPFLVYGPGQKDRFVPNMIENIYNGDPVTLYGSDGIRVNPIYVKDAAAGMMAALSSGENEVFNLAGLEVTNIRELARMIGEMLGREPKFRVIDEPPEDYVADMSKAARKLDFFPRVGLKEGISRVCKAFLESRHSERSKSACRLTK